MIMVHDNRRLTQAKVYVIGFVFGAYVQRFHFCRDIGLIGQTVY